MRNLNSLATKVGTRNPLSDLDPFIESDSLTVEPTSRESLRSFWIGFAGLAVLAHVMIFLELLTTRYVVVWLRSEAYKTPWPNWRSEAIGVLGTVSGESLLPCIVLATVVPILFWRGGLAQRFALSTVLVIAAMNSSISQRWWENFSYSELKGVFAIVGCWVMFPFLFLFTPIRTRQLRLIVAICMLVLTLCVSVINMIDLRRSFELLYWESVFGSAFCYALLRRNWGKVAMIESGANKDQIERTSSRTLLELMAVSGLACSSVMYWSESSYAGLLLYFVQASVLGIASVLVSMTCYRKMSECWQKHILLLIASWLTMWLFISANSFLIFRYKRHGYPTWTSLLNTPMLYSIVACGCCASLLLLIHISIVEAWLRFCGWRIERGVTPVQG